MRSPRSLLCALLFLAGFPAKAEPGAQIFLAPASASAVLPGTFTVTTLPPAAANQAKYAFVTDLGGGADMVLSDGSYWKHVRQGVLTNIPAASAITLTPLSSPPIIQLTGSGVSSVNLTIATAGLYPGYTVHIITPNGVLAALGTFGISTGGSTVPIIGAAWEDVQWNGSALIKLSGGSL